MGNRAVIRMQGQETGIYLHYNGGYDTVKPLLDVAKEYGIRGDDYGIARLAQIMGNFFGGTLSIGVATLENLDQENGDNGTYVIDENFNIVERLYFKGREQSNWNYEEMKAHIKSINDQFFKVSEVNLSPPKNKWDGHYPMARYCVCDGCVESGVVNASAEVRELRY